MREDQPGGREVNVRGLRKMRKALDRPVPRPKGSKGIPGQVTPHVAAAAARGRSTTAQRGPKQPAEGGQQAGQLRRAGNEQQGHKPIQKQARRECCPRA
ncbi:hypothetical protein ACIRU3_44210 [Streptomyces sp. NPDC101151]|uniref:hypothetical protein n=1 Tax=Streptomyces sp. NPDC101151 TaxID=3366115 RepID=UPI003822BFD8